MNRNRVVKGQAAVYAASETDSVMNVVSMIMVIMMIIIVIMIRIIMIIMIVTEINGHKERRNNTKKEMNKSRYPRLGLTS